MRPACCLLKPTIEHWDVMCMNVDIAVILRMVVDCLSTNRDVCFCQKVLIAAIFILKHYGQLNFTIINEHM